MTLMILKRPVLKSRNLGFNEINFNLFADIQARSQKFPMSGLFENFCIFLKK